MKSRNDSMQHGNIFFLYDYVFGEKAKSKIVLRPATKKEKPKKTITETTNNPSTATKKRKDISPEEANKKMENSRVNESYKKIDEFREILQTELLDKIFRSTLRQLGSIDLETLLFENVTDALSISKIPDYYVFPTDEEIQSLFMNINAVYCYFSEDQQKNAIEQFSVFFKACKLIADYTERNNDDDNSVAVEHAYKMMVLFGYNDRQKARPFHHVEEYFRQIQSDSRTPVHDALVQPIPVNKPPIRDLDGWRKLIINNKNGIAYFQQAPQIEKQLGRAPLSVREAEEVSSKIVYSRYEEYPELAYVCKSNHVSEEIFNRCIEIEKNRKQSDNIPDVVVDGNKSGFPGYYLVKLPIDDPRAYILGEITKCCQSIGGHSEKCVIDGVTRQNNGFYVLLKGKKNLPPLKEGKIDHDNFDIIGQGYTWITKKGNLTIDSWESLREEDDKIIAAMLPELGKLVNEKNDNILRITIGTGGKTPKMLRKATINSPEEMIEGTQYGDSKYQALLTYTTKSFGLIEDIKIIARNTNHLFSQNDVILDMIIHKQELSSKEDFVKLESIFKNNDGNQLLKLLYHSIYSREELLIALSNMTDEQKEIFFSNPDSMSKVVNLILFDGFSPQASFRQNWASKIREHRALNNKIFWLIPKKEQDKVQDFCEFITQNSDDAMKIAGTMNHISWSSDFKDIRNDISQHIPSKHMLLFIKGIIGKDNINQVIKEEKEKHGWYNQNSIVHWLKMLDYPDYKGFLDNVVNKELLVTWYHKNQSKLNGLLSYLSNDQKKTVLSSIESIVQQEEMVAESILHNIENLIINKNWEYFLNFFGGVGGATILLENGQKKSLPANVMLQWDTIQQAKRKEIPFTKALEEVADIARKADFAGYNSGLNSTISSKIISLLRTESTKEWYGLFYGDYKERFSNPQLR